MNHLKLLESLDPAERAMLKMALTQLTAARFFTVVQRMLHDECLDAFIVNPAMEQADAENILRGAGFGLKTVMRLESLARDIINQEAEG